MRPDLTVQAWYRSYKRIDPNEAEEIVAGRLRVDADQVQVVDVRADSVLTQNGLGQIKGYQIVYEFVVEVVV